MEGRHVLLPFRCARAHGGRHRGETSDAGETKISHLQVGVIDHEDINALQILRR